MPTLARILVDYDPDLLEIIASQWDIDIKTSDRLAAADELAAQMTVAAATLATWERLAPDDQAALRDLMANEGRMPFAHFTRRFGEIRPMGPARREREKPWLEPASLTEKLYYRGLIIRGFEQTPAGAQEYILIPAEILKNLPQPAPDEMTETPGYAVAPPRILRDGFDTAPDDIATLLGYLIAKPGTNAHEWVGCETLPDLDQYLRRPNNPAYRCLLIQLAYELHLIYDEELMGVVETKVDRDVVQAWLRAPRVHQLRSLTETWLESYVWNDLAYTPGLDAEEWLNDPRVARQVLLDTLRHVPGDIWWSLNGLLEHIKKTNPDFQRPGGDYRAWYVRDAYTDEILHGFQFWDYIDGALLRFIVEGPLHWFGVVRVERGTFILTDLGLALLGHVDWPSTPDPIAFINVDEQGVIDIPIAISRYDRLQIARFTSWISAPLPAAFVPGGDNADEGYYRYRLTAQSIQRVQDKGITLETHIVPFLKRLSGESIPPNVLEMLYAWRTEPNEVIVEDVVIVRARHIGAYERLRKNKGVSRWLGQQVGPNAHAVKREHLPALLNAIRQMGLLPLFDGHDKDDRP